MTVLTFPPSVSVWGVFTVAVLTFPTTPCEETLPPVKETHTTPTQECIPYNTLVHV